MLKTGINEPGQSWPLDMRVYLQWRGWLDFRRDTPQIDLFGRVELNSPQISCSIG